MPSTPPAPNSVFDGVLKLGGKVLGILAGIAYPDEITTIGDTCKSPKIALATPVFARWKKVAGTQTALPTNFCGILLAERPLSNDRSKGSLTVIKDDAKV